MPFVRVTLFKGRTREQKASIAQAITDAMVNIGKAKKDEVWIVFEDTPPEEWAMGGKLAG